MTVVLVVDDEPRITTALRTNLAARGYVVREAGTGRAAQARVEVDRPDVVILDLGLPDMDGTEVIRRLRRISDIPILVLTARPDERDKVEALDAGADDYVTKPFGMEELLARLRALLRRAEVGGPAEVVSTASFELDLQSRTATRAGRSVHLTPTEWEIVVLLARRAGRLVTREALLRGVWGEGFDDASGYVRVHLASIRRKLEPDHAHPVHFLTVPRQGLRFVPDPDGLDRDR